MIFRALTIDYDWEFGKGIQSYLKDTQAIGMNIRTRLLSFLNDCFFDSQAGIDWIRLLGTRSTKEEIILNCRAIILQSFGVTKVNSISSEFTNRNLSLTYEINTIFSQGFSDSLEVG